MLRCFGNVSEQLIPKDAADFSTIHFHWQFRMGTEYKDYPKDVASDISRIKIHPKTGKIQNAISFYAILE